MHPDTRTVVFIHGNFVTRHCWDRWIPHYEARGYRCHAIAYPGRDKPVAELKAAPLDPFLAALTLEATIEHHVREIRALDEKPIIVGHSFGGLLTQLMVQRDLAVAAVAIDSVPPPGVVPYEWSSVRSLLPVLNPLVPVSRPYYMPFEHFRYTFANDLAPDEQRAAYDAEVVPESRRLARGGLSAAARIDFKRPHAPLLLVGGGRDHIMPASLNRRNHRAYAAGPSRTEYQEFPGLAHYSVIGGPGWEAVADHALDWAIEASAERTAAA